MALASGTRIGPYEILAPLGQGGMGEVYRARDARLDRLVAIKSLPPAFATDPGRLARFEREAKLLASLNHPNVAAIYGLEDAGGFPYLVLEFVDGETLAARLARGPLAARDAIEIGAQIASGVEAAHERGVVHRDLKPGNVMLTRAGVVKVLDFGLAKGDPGETAPPSDLSISPTAAMSATGTGMILGTASYMSPEQARGKPVDRRTDVWSFGCMLFECLTGRQAFGGETLSDVIARILEREPDWSLIPAGAPPRLRELVSRCLTKNVAERPRSIGDLRLELAAIATDGSPVTRASAQAAPASPSLAVLYFENLSSDPESDYFCAGITEDILTDLSKIKGMRVASRHAVARFRGAAVDIPRVASELGVGVVLEGSVRRAGDRVRISAQLIDAADGFHLWAERYDRTLQDVFAVQEEIASSIATALRGALTPAESRSLNRERPADVRAYDLYLKGREYYGRRTLDSLHYALELFEQAVAIEPDYARAWAGIADCHAQLLQWGAGEQEESIRRGLEAARHAIALDPRIAEGHKAEALVLKMAGDTQASRAATLRAIEVNPRFTPSILNLAVDEFGSARVASAERLLRQALEIDPQEPFGIAWLNFLCLMTGRHEEALAGSDRLRRISSNPFYVMMVHSIRAEHHMRRAEYGAAEREIKEGHAAGAEPANLRTLEAAIAARTGYADRAGRLLGLAEASAELRMQSLMTAARVAIGRGEMGRAVGFMQRLTVRELANVLVRLDPELHALLEDPPFAPPRSSLALVWPREAPPPHPKVRECFSEVRVESGLPGPESAGA
jgi:serine/threonine protein kinase/tetratricopeptide (TPR) repeat protein